MLVNQKIVVEAGAGDYTFLLQKHHDGTFRCFRKPIDDSRCDELSDWSQLPPQVREVFTRARSQAAG